MSGLCECGCGIQTNAMPHSDKKRGWVKGFPFKYIRGHNSRGSKHNMYKNGIQKWGNGYLCALDHKNKRSDSRGRFPVHVIIAESVLGKQLPDSAIVHHANGNKSDNSHENLVICENKRYHEYLHQRKRAYDACGNANWRKCSHCKMYDDIANLRKRTTSECHYHISCVSAYNKKLYHKNKGKK